jgi:hypothetical protein
VMDAIPWPFTGLWPFAFAAVILATPTFLELVAWSIAWPIGRRRFKGRRWSGWTAGFAIVLMIAGVLILLFWPVSPARLEQPASPGLIISLVGSVALILGGFAGTVVAGLLWGVYEIVRALSRRPEPETRP